MKRRIYALMRATISAARPASTSTEVVSLDPTAVSIAFLMMLIHGVFDVTLVVHEIDHILYDFFELLAIVVAPKGFSHEREEVQIFHPNNLSLHESGLKSYLKRVSPLLFYHGLLVVV